MSLTAALLFLVVAGPITGWLLSKLVNYLSRDLPDASHDEDCGAVEGGRVTSSIRGRE